MISHGCMIERSARVADTIRVVVKTKLEGLPEGLPEVERMCAALPRHPSHGKDLAPSREVPWICLE